MFKLIPLPGFLIAINILPLKAQLPAGIGVKTGINISNLYPGRTFNPLYNGYHATTGFTAAIRARMNLLKHFSFQTQVEFLHLGAQKNGNQAIPVTDLLKQTIPAEAMPAYVYADCSSNTRLNYLVIPALVIYRWGKINSHWRRYAGAGPFLGILLSAKTRVSGNNITYLDAAHTQPLLASPQSLNMTRSLNSQVNVFNTGITTLAGIVYKTGRLRYFIEAGGSYGFGNLLREDTPGSLYTGTLNISAGIEFRFSIFDTDK